MQTVAPFAEAIEEIRKAGADSSRLCFQCGKCDVYCPWNTVRDFSIRKIIREATFGLTEIEGDDIWRCTTCGNCPSQCPRGVEQIEVGVDAVFDELEAEIFSDGFESGNTSAWSAALP